MTPTQTAAFLMGFIGLALIVRWIVLYQRAGGGGWISAGDPAKSRAIRTTSAELLIFAIACFALAFADLI